MRAMLVAALELCVGCTVGEVTNEKHASASLVAKRGSTVTGTATFTQHGTSLAYRWTDNIEQNTATLRKS